MRIWNFKTFTVILALLFCFGTLGVAFAQEKEPLLVGSIWDQVGFGGQIGQICYRGSQLAVDLVNEAGGIFGRKVVYINIDGQSELDVICLLYTSPSPR